MRRLRKQPNFSNPQGPNKLPKRKRKVPLIPLPSRKRVKGNTKKGASPKKEKEDLLNLLSAQDTKLQDQDETFEILPLAVDSDEFQLIRKIVTIEEVDNDTRQLYGVDKVIHSGLLTTYLQRKQKMNPPTETLLFHGTSKNDPFHIANVGFDIRAGRGFIYGAAKANYSLEGYSHHHLTMKNGHYKSSIRGKKKSILLCRTLLGKVGNSRFRMKGGGTFSDSASRPAFQGGSRVYWVASSDQFLISHILHFQPTEILK